MPTQVNHSTKTFLKVFVFFLTLPKPLIAATVDGRWQLGIGDASIFGWITTAVYFLVVLRCMFNAKTSHRQGGNFGLWIALAGLMLLLGINKQLDLQTWLTQSLKDISIQHGWYAQRRGVQMAFIIALGLGMVIALVTLRFFLLNAWHHHKLIWLGLILLSTFILVRAASFHHIDLLISTTWMGVKLNVLLELGALTVILWGTLVKQKVASFHSVKLSEINPIVVVDKEGDVARCPQCGKQAVAPTVHQRKFKCRRCGYLYRVHVAGKPVQ
jgi:ribosomal protein S27AE